MSPLRNKLWPASALAFTLLATLPAVAGPDLDGARVYQDNCGRCHQPRTPGDLSASGWKAVAFHMRVTANLSRAEFNALEAFLVPAPAQPATGTAARPVEGNPVLAGNCLVCHDSERIQTAVNGARSEADWNATLARMRTYGAKVTPEQAAELARWLATEAPPSP